MKKEEKIQLRNLKMFYTRVVDSMSLSLLKGILEIDMRNTSPFELNGQELSRLSTKLGIELAQCMLKVTNNVISIVAEERGSAYGAPRVVTVASDEYSDEITWEDIHPDAILTVIMELRLIIADRVANNFRKALALYPEDETPGAEPDEE